MASFGFRLLARFEPQPERRAEIGAQVRPFGEQYDAGAARCRFAGRLDRSAGAAHHDDIGVKGNRNLLGRFDDLRGAGWTGR